MRNIIAVATRKKLLKFTTDSGGLHVTDVSSITIHFRVTFAWPRDGLKVDIWFQWLDS
jgi:hypothetical protein